MTNALPSWMRWPPNCCETCVSWSKDKHVRYCGMCTSAVSMDSGEITDCRYRCPSFMRKDEPYDRDGYGEGSDGR
jgi:hypothetical protein